MERKQMAQNLIDATPHVGVLAALAGWLPPVAALFSILWISIQLAEKFTGKPAHVLCQNAVDRAKAVWKRICS